MSGQPIRKPNDASRFREDYLNTLNLRADIDKMNLEANNVYKQTGQLPPMSQMPDTRTTTEILADKQKLTTDLIGELKNLYSPNVVLGMIQEIEKHPLNTDGAFFLWFAQNASELGKELKKKYRYGVKGDSNDILTFVSYLSKIYTQTRNNLVSVKQAFNAPISKTSYNTPSEIQNLIQSLTTLRLRLRTLFHYNGIDIPTLRDIDHNLDQLIATLSNRPNQRLLTGEFVNILPANNAAYYQLQEFLKHIPDQSMFYTLFDKIQRASDEHNIDAMNEALGNILQLFHLEN